MENSTTKRSRAWCGGVKWRGVAQSVRERDAAARPFMLQRFIANPCNFDATPPLPREQFAPILSRHKLTILCSRSDRRDTCAPTDECRGCGLLARRVRLRALGLPSRCVEPRRGREARVPQERGSPLPGCSGRYVARPAQFSSGCVSDAEGEGRWGRQGERERKWLPAGKRIAG